MVQLLGLWGSWQCQACRYTNCLSHRSYGLFRAFSKSLASGDQKASLAGPPLLHPFLSMAAWLSSASISHHSLPPRPLCLSLYSQWQPPHWDCSTIPMLQLPAAAPSRGPTSLSGVCMAMARIVCVPLILFTLSKITGFTLSLKCFFSVSNNCLDEGIGPLLQFPHSQRAHSVLLTLLFSPYFLHPTPFCMVLYTVFWLVRHSCPLSTGGLQALLCLKVYSWCICGERCTLCPPTPLPACSLQHILFIHSTADTHVGCFTFLVIMNDAAIYSN